MVQPQVKISPAEYLAFERAAEVRHEYHNGEIIEMPGTTYIHALIVGNLMYLFKQWFKGKMGQAVSESIRLTVPSEDRYFYPDIMLLTGTPQLVDNTWNDTLTNPAVVIEVLSDSTEKNDREIKSLAYRTLPSLQAYLLVSQKEYFIELYERTATEEWKLTVIQGADQSFNLLGCDLKLADIYDKVQF